MNGRTNKRASHGGKKKRRDLKEGTMVLFFFVMTREYTIMDT